MTSDDGELHNPMNLWSLDQRIEAIDADGIDVQLTSPTDVFYQYHQDPAVTATIASAVNDEVAEMVRARPTGSRAWQRCRCRTPTSRSRSSPGLSVTLACAA
jgi:hypothetical protein